MATFIVIDRGVKPNGSIPVTHVEWWTVVGEKERGLAESCVLGALHVIFDQAKSLLERLNSRVRLRSSRQNVVVVY